jgi:hypothetical protein
VEATVYLEGGGIGTASVPAGASRGSYEAHELRDGDARYGGRGVLGALYHITKLISPALSIGFTLPLILPLFYLPALGGFMSMYAAYPNIRRYMIDGKTELSSYTIEEDADELADDTVEDVETEETELTPPPPEAD